MGIPSPPTKALVFVPKLINAGSLIDHLLRGKIGRLHLSSRLYTLLQTRMAQTVSHNVMYSYIFEHEMSRCACIHRAQKFQPPNRRPAHSLLCFPMLFLFSVGITWMKLWVFVNTIRLRQQSVVAISGLSRGIVSSITLLLLCLIMTPKTH